MTNSLDWQHWLGKARGLGKLSAMTRQNVGEGELAALAEALAPRLRPGDFIALHGELGAGKTTFARALIRALLANPDEEVPSPTFAVVHPY